ncbi:glycosyltransferase family 4 protein [Flavobacterium facile]|uniref:glycosyltransferase family 4 protein n=1 Tax=Flavobacterium facile TaxID=2893174 RepID=UPI002E76F86A|nr:glycosyltransferase family 1 protein [Flavobacterium sp. T-12]
MNIGFEAKRVFHNKTGLGNYSRDLVRILATYFPDHLYFLYNPKPYKKTLFVSNTINVFEKNPISKFNQKFKNIWRQKTVVKDLVKDQIAIYHGLSGELPIGLEKKGIKSVVTIHDLIFVRYPNLYSFFDRKIHFYKFKKAVERANLVIAISEQTKKDIITYLHIDADKIRVVYQGCQDVFKKEYADAHKKLVVKKFHLPESFVLNVGTIEERKNALTIVKAIKNLDVHLVLIGKETEYSQKIHQYISENKLEQRVHFLKGLSSEELAIVYQLASVFVYPSIFEGFGIPIIEALYSKTPVITNKTGVFSEAAGPNSLYIEPFDVEDLSHKIEKILTDKSLASKMKAEGFKFVQQFNDEVIATKLFSVYNELV